METVASIACGSRRTLSEATSLSFTRGHPVFPSSLFLSSRPPQNKSCVTGACDSLGIRLPYRARLGCVVRHYPGFLRLTLPRRVSPNLAFLHQMRSRQDPDRILKGIAGVIPLSPCACHLSHLARLAQPGKAYTGTVQGMKNRRWRRQELLRLGNSDMQASAAEINDNGPM